MKTIRSPFITQNQRLIFLLFLGCVEFSLAAIISLWFFPVSENTFLFGYSFARLTLAGLSLSLAIWLLILATNKSIRSKFTQKFEDFVQKAPLMLRLGII